MRTLRCLPFALAWLLAAIPAPAGAQIYTWRDAQGNLVASDHPPQGGDRSYRVIGSMSFRATRPVDGRYTGAYDQLIEKHAATYAVSPQLVRAVMQVESGFNPRAVSVKGAAGLMQLMPSTAIEMGVRNVFDPDENIRGGVAYLRQLLNRYGGDVQLALAAYNAGPEAVARHGNQVPPYRETRNYVSKVRSRTDGNGTIAPPPPRARRAPASNGTARVANAAPPPARIYHYWERTPDGRLIPRWTDTKPPSGPYDIVR